MKQKPEDKYCRICQNKISLEEFDANGGICNNCYAEAEEERR